MKTIFIAAVDEWNGKYLAYTLPIKVGQNIKSIWGSQKNAIIFHLCESRKQADDLVIAWNQAYKNNGTYYFDFPIYEE